MQLDIVTRPVDGLEPHPLSAEIFGELPPEKFLELQEDIDEVGLRYPLELDIHGRVICGSQRLRAIKRLGWQEVQCIIRSDLLEEDDIRAWLVKDNTLRRQLNHGQIFRAGKEMERILAARALKRKADNLPNAPNVCDQTLGTPGRTDEQVANELGITRNAWRDNKTVFESGDEKLMSAVEHDLKTVAKAAKEVRQQRQTTATELAPKDHRRLPVRVVKWQRIVDSYRDWIIANPPTEFEHLKPKAHQSLVALADAVAKAIKQAE